MTRLRDEAARGDVNLMPAIIAGGRGLRHHRRDVQRAARSYGEYREPLAV